MDDGSPGRSVLESRDQLSLSRAGGPHLKIEEQQRSGACLALTGAYSPALFELVPYPRAMMLGVGAFPRTGSWPGSLLARDADQPLDMGERQQSTGCDPERRRDPVGQSGRLPTPIRWAEIELALEQVSPRCPQGYGHLLPAFVFGLSQPARAYSPGGSLPLHVVRRQITVVPCPTGPSACW